MAWRAFTLAALTAAPAVANWVPGSWGNYSHTVYGGHPPPSVWRMGPPAYSVAADQDMLDTKEKLADPTGLGPSEAAALLRELISTSPGGITEAVEVAGTLVERYKADAPVVAAAADAWIQWGALEFGLSLALQCAALGIAEDEPTLPCHKKPGMDMLDLAEVKACASRVVGLLADMNPLRSASQAPRLPRRFPHPACLPPVAAGLKACGLAVPHLHLSSLLHSRLALPPRPDQDLMLSHVATLQLAPLLRLLTKAGPLSPEPVGRGMSLAYWSQQQDVYITTLATIFLTGVTPPSPPLRLPGTAPCNCGPCPEAATTGQYLDRHRAHRIRSPGGDLTSIGWCAQLDPLRVAQGHELIGKGLPGPHGGAVAARLLAAGRDTVPRRLVAELWQSCQASQVPPCPTVLL
eukprot:gene2533-3271_t